MGFWFDGMKRLETEKISGNKNTKNRMIRRIKSSLSKINLIPNFQVIRTLSNDAVRVIFGHHMRVGFCLWAIELARVMRKISYFRIGIIWGAVPMIFPVFWISFSGRSMNSYGTSPNLWVPKKSSGFDKAPKIRDSVLLNSFESFSVTLPSISSETWEIESWVNSGSSTFCPLLLLLPSGVSLETAANFLLFLNVAILLEGKSCQWLRLNLSLLVLIKVSSKSEGIKFQQFKQSKKVILRRVTLLKVAIVFFIIIVLSFLLFIPFLGGKHICLHARSRYK